MATHGNKRVFPRYAIELGATVDAGGISSECMARDFCRSGMFLAFSRPPETLPANGQEVSVQLAPGGDARQRFATRVRVARVLEQGIGVSFVEDSEPLLEFLTEQVRKRTLEQSAPPVEPFPYDEDRRRDLIRVCRELIAGRLNPLMRRFVDEAEKRFMNNEWGMVLGPQRFTIQQQLRDMGDELGSRWIASLLDAFATAGAEVLAGGGVQDDTLSLVGDDQLQDWIVVSAFVSRVEGSREVTLFELQHRLGVVLGRSFSRETNPIGPHQVGRQFLSRLTTIDLDGGLQNRLWKLFEELAGDALGGLCAKLNSFLLEQGIVPEVKKLYHVVKSDTQRVRRSGGGEGEERSSAVGAGRASLASRLFPDTADISQTPAALSLEALDVAASGQQRLAASGSGVFTGMVAPAIPNASSGLARRLDMAAMERIQRLETLLLTLQQEPILDEQIKYWLERVELPIARAALRDQELAHDPSHPFYTLLDLLGRVFLLLPTEAQTERQQLLEQAEHALADLVRDADALTQPIASLERMLEERSVAIQARLDELAADCRAHPSRRQQVLAMLTDVDRLFDRIPERRVPAVLLELFDAGWKNLLWKAYARDGEQGASYRNRRAAIELLLLRLCGVDAPKQPDDERLVAAVRNDLGKNGGDATLAERVTTQLTEALNQARRDPSLVRCLRRDSVQRQALEGWSREWHDERPQEMDDLAWREWLMRAEAIEVGDWFVFRDGETSRWRRLLHREEAGRLLFADGMESQPVDLSFVEMARRWAAGELEPAPGLESTLGERLLKQVSVIARIR